MLLRRKSGSKIDYLRLNMDPNSWSERTSTQQRHSFGREHQLLHFSVLFIHTRPPTDSFDCVFFKMNYRRTPFILSMTIALIASTAHAFFSEQIHLSYAGKLIFPTETTKFD